jgi:hypothetical protein
MATPRVYAAGGSAGNPIHRASWGSCTMQTAQPRDVGALILVIGMFLVLFVVTLLMGSPIR